MTRIVVFKTVYMRTQDNRHPCTVLKHFLLQYGSKNYHVGWTRKKLNFFQNDFVINLKYTWKKS